MLFLASLNTPSHYWNQGFFKCAGIYEFLVAGNLAFYVGKLRFWKGLLEWSLGGLWNRRGCFWLPGLGISGERILDILGLGHLLCIVLRWKVARSVGICGRTFDRGLFFLRGFLVRGFELLSWSASFLACFLEPWSGPIYKIFLVLLIYLVIRIMFY